MLVRRVLGTCTKMYINNYFDTFKKCKYVFCTFAPLGKGGYHHVNTQDQNYWIETFKKFDFEFEEEKTESIRKSSTINKNFVREYGLLFKNNYKIFRMSLKKIGFLFNLFFYIL